MDFEAYGGRTEEEERWEEMSEVEEEEVVEEEVEEEVVEEEVEEEVVEEEVVVVEEVAEEEGGLVDTQVFEFFLPTCLVPPFFVLAPRFLVGEGTPGDSLPPHAAVREAEVGCD